VDLVVNVGQVSGGGTLADTAELIINGSVAKANPALVCTEIRHGNATQMGANSGAAQDWGITGFWDGCFRFLIKQTGGGEGVSEVDLGLGKTTYEDHLSVPGGLSNFSWGKFRDIEFLVGITNVSVSGDHLIVNNGKDGLDTENVGWDNESLDHVGLGTSDLVVSILFVPKSVLIEPVIDFGLDIKRVAEVAGAGWGNPKHVAVSAEQVVSQFPVFSFVVLLHDTKVTYGLAYQKNVS
jgi:hypothetical protein